MDTRGRKIPRRPDGYPDFKHLFTRVQSVDEWTAAYQLHGEDLLLQFNEEEIVGIVNWSLHQLEKIFQVNIHAPLGPLDDDPTLRQSTEK